MEKVKTILVSQPKPATEKSPYFNLAEKMKVKIDFRPFIHVEGVDSKEFKKEKINPLDFSAIILTSRNAVDHFFRVCEDLGVEMPGDTKYFCISESTAVYLQKYIVYRKRKVFFGKQTMGDLMDILKKHQAEKFLLPCSDILKDSIPTLLEGAKIDYTKAVLYKTVASDLSDLSDITYDMLVFFSPAGIKSLYKNFPDFKQNKTRIATFGKTTLDAAEEYGLEVQIPAPLPNAPSMTMAIEQYIKSIK